MTASVLIVEDDPRPRETFARAVREAPGLRLAGVASDLRSGLRQLTDEAPDVLLVDLGLPDGHGIELIHHVREHLVHCDAIVVTVFDDDESLIDCIRAGATGYLLKDATEIDIVDAIRRVREGGSPISPSIARKLLSIARGRAQTPRARDFGAPVALAPQELAVLTFSAKGYNYDEIACLMALSRNTVETYVKRLYRKLQVHTKTEAVYEGRQRGLLDD